MSLHCKAESSCSHHKMKFIRHLCVSTMCVICKPTTKAMIANYLYCTIFHADTPVFRISRLTPAIKAFCVPAFCLSALLSSVVPFLLLALEMCYKSTFQLAQLTALKPLHRACLISFFGFVLAGKCPLPK